MAKNRCCFNLRDFSVTFDTNLEFDFQIHMLAYGLMNRLYGCVPSDFDDFVCLPGDPDSPEAFTVAFNSNKMKDFRDE